MILYLTNTSYFKIIFGAVTDQDASSYLIIYFTNIKPHEIININNNSLNCVDFTIKSETSFIHCWLGPKQFRIGETLDKPNFTGFSETYKKNIITQHPHYFTVALLQLRIEGVFKYTIIVNLKMYVSRCLYTVNFLLFNIADKLKFRKNENRINEVLVVLTMIVYSLLV